MASTQHPKLFVVHQARRPKELPEEFRPAFEQRADAFGVAMESYYAKVTDASTGSRFTRNGALQEIRTLSLQQLKEIDDARTAMRDKLKVQIAAAKAPRFPKAEEPVLRYLRHRDIWTHVAAQTPEQQRVLIMQAEADGDDDFLDALATVPRYLRKVDQNLVAAARERLAEAGNPEVAKLSSLLRSYDFLYGAAEQVVREAARSVGLVDLIPDAGPTPDAQKVRTLSGTPVPESVR
jgi:hypothetical protein